MIEKDQLIFTHIKKITTVSILALCFSICAILQVYSFTFKQPGYDFYNFWTYTQELRHSDVPNFHTIEFDRFVAKKYLGEAQKDENQSNFRRAALWNAKIYEQGHIRAATPFFYASLATVSSEDYDTDLISFQLISTLIFCFSTYAICRALGNSISTVLLIISFLLLFWTPFYSDTEVANLARMQAGLLGICILTWHCFNNRRGFILGGLLLGIIVLFKPNIVGVPISFAIIWFFQRRYRKLLFVMLGVSLGGLIALSYSAIYFGAFSCWTNWFHAIVDLQQNPFPVGYFNLSLAGLIDYYFRINLSIPILLGLFFSYLLCCYHAKKKRVQMHANLSGSELIEDLLGMGVGLIMIFMAFKVVWDHYLLLLAPVLLALMNPIQIKNQISDKKSDIAAQVISGVLFLIYALLPLRRLLPTASSYDIATIIGIASLTFWGLLLFRLYRCGDGSS